MTVDTLLGTLFTAFRKELDDASVTLYERGMADVPVALLDAAIVRAVRTRTFLPSIAELRQDAEACRAELLRRHPHRPCDACKDSGGWLTVTDAEGVDRLAKCPCIDRWRAQLQQLGVTATPVFLPLPVMREGSEA